MLSLNKITDLIKETNKEVIVAQDEPIVIMSMKRYRELISSQRYNKEIPISHNNLKQIEEKDYLDQVKQTIMPETGISN